MNGSKQVLSRHRQTLLAPALELINGAIKIVVLYVMSRIQICQNAGQGWVLVTDVLRS